MIQLSNDIMTYLFQFSDDEDDSKRVVRSAREKRNEQLHTIMKTIRNSRKIKDFNKMETSFQELIKAYEKTKVAIMKDEGGVTPRFYVRILVEMEDLVNETWEDKEYLKTMSKINKKSLNGLRQKLRKYIRDFDDDMAKFRENPDAEDEPEEQDADQDDSEGSDDEGGKARKSFSKSREGSESVDKEKFKSRGGDDDESDDSYWDSDSDETSESSSDDEPGMSLREKFLKKSTDDGDEKKRERKERKEKKKKSRALRDIDESDEDLDDKDQKWITVDHGGLEKPKMFEKDAEITHSLVVKKLHEIMAARGKKRTNRKEQIELLTELLSISEEHNLDVAIYVKIQFAIISAIFDYNPKVSSAMKPEYWELCMPAIETILEQLHNNVEDLTTGDQITDENESFEEKPYKVRGCFLSCVERMDEEFVKVLKGCDAHTHEYVERLKDEPRVISILDSAQRLVESKKGSASDLCRIYLKRIEHIYFKFDTKVIQQKKVS